MKTVPEYDFVPQLSVEGSEDTLCMVPAFREDFAPEVPIEKQIAELRYRTAPSVCLITVLNVFTSRTTSYWYGRFSYIVSVGCLHIRVDFADVHGTSNAISIAILRAG